MKEMFSTCVHGNNTANARKHIEKKRGGGGGGVA